MARFSQQFLQSLTQPSFGQGLFTAAKQLGATPTLMAEQQKKQQQLQRFDAISQLSGQAQASAIAGDPNALAESIKKLEALRDASPLLKEKQAIDARITQLRDLTRTARLQAQETANKAISQQIFQIKDLESLETTTEKLLKVEGADAEAIKKFADVQQRSILNKKERDRIAEENSFDMTTNVNDIRKRLDDLPDEVQAIVESKLSRAEDMQKQYRSGGTWTNTKARNFASKLIDDAADDIEQYVMTEITLDQRTIAGLEAKISDLVAKGPGTPNRNDLKATENRLAIEKHGKEFDDLNSSRKKEIQRSAAKEEQERLNNKHNREITARQRQLSAFRGEEIAEEKTGKKTPEIRPLEGPEDYDGMVSNALARGNNPQYVRNSLEKIGVPAKTIIGLIDKYKLPQTTDF